MRKVSIYEAIGTKTRKNLASQPLVPPLLLHDTVRQIRLEKGLSGADLCRSAGDLDAKTLTAVEKGRIKNPSIRTLQSLARGLGISVADLFRRAEMGSSNGFYQGTQKGAYQMEFSRKGIKIVSFTPLVRDFFCGKMIFSSKKTLDETILNHKLPVFISVLIGRFQIDIENQTMVLKEGDNLFFNGMLKHSFTNLLHRESVLWMVTAPSFL